MRLQLDPAYVQLAEAVRRLCTSDVGRATRVGEHPADVATRLRLLEALAGLGLTDLDLRHEYGDCLAAGQAVREVGAAVVGVPAVSRLVGAAAGLDGLLVAVGRPRADHLLVEHLDLGLPVQALRPDGRLFEVTAVDGPRADGHSAPYASTGKLRDTGRRLDPWFWAVSVVLTGFAGAGQLEETRRISAAHVTARTQFGKPLAGFQSVANRIAELAGREGALRELCNYTLWRLNTSPETATVDALMLRHYHLRAVREAMLHAHQVHGALGFCYEYPLAGLHVAGEYDRRVPLTLAETTSELVPRWTEIETLYDVLPPAWPLLRSDTVDPAVAGQPFTGPPLDLDDLADGSGADVSMDYSFGPALEGLRAALRARIAAAFPDGFPTIFVDDPNPLEGSHAFCRRMGADGLLVLAWPREYGGREASLWAQVVIGQEMWAHDEPRGGQYFGPNWLGPAIMAFGTEAQKRELLPEIARGEGLWAQGYSEPEAGSDLASLRLRADRVEGGWSLTGQKIWTTYAGYAKRMIVATRTDPSGPKHHGITVFLITTDRPGIEVRPIAAMLGPHDLNEVFFDGAFVSEDEVLGEVDDGWRVMRASLGFERTGIPRYSRSERLLSEARAALLALDDEPDPHVVARWVRSAVGCRVARAAHYRAVAETERAGGGAVPPLFGSVYRMLVTLNDQWTTITASETLGDLGLAGTSGNPVHVGGDLDREWRHGLPATVAAGTYEVQQMIVAREVLGVGTA